MKVKTLKKENETRNRDFSSILKGTLLALSVAMVMILLFAFVLRFTSVSDKLIAPVNQVIKGVSIFFGVIAGLKKHKTKGLVNGLLIGLGFTVVAFLVFSLLDGAFVFDRTFFNDLIFGSVIGAICGIICVNLKKN